MTRPPFYLTRRAARDLRDIHARSVTSWGRARADTYLDEIYAVFAKVAAAPDLGQLRAHRSAPFLMVPAGRHFVVYDRAADGVIVLTVLHQARDIERIIAELEPSFLAEIEALKRATGSSSGE
jgi:plasmid stabilization system protein ParE